MKAEIIGGKDVVIEGEHAVPLDGPGLAVDVECGGVESDLHAGGKGLHAGGDVGGIERLAGAGGYPKGRSVVGGMEHEVCAGEMEAVVDRDVTDGRFHVKAVE